TIQPLPAARPTAPKRAERQGLPLGGIPGVPRKPRAERTEAEPGAEDVRLDALATATPEPVPPPAEPVPQAWAPAPPGPQRERVPEPALDVNEDPLDADMRAAEYIANRDPRAAQAALVAARHFIAKGHTNAASDLLLQLIASGLADHQAQRLLVDVVSSIGKRDVARAKCALLAQALRLDGQAELAAEVDRLAQAV
ncbi:MAG: hypothetical protein QOH08_1136, partial [Chloroflexota bacterium]|nr:hypothetical protein [Chloroflexota bacterium]